GLDAAAAFFGAAACGAVAINVNETLRPRQVEHIVTHSGSAAIITSQDLLGRQPRALETSVRIHIVEAITGDAAFEPVYRVVSDYAQIIYTSGSTGLPKGVTLMHGNLWAG